MRQLKRRETNEEGVKCLLNWLSNRLSNSSEVEGKKLNVRVLENTRSGHLVPLPRQGTRTTYNRTVFPSRTWGCNARMVTTITVDVRTI